MTWLSNEAVERLKTVATWPELPPDRYTLVEPIGRGGMGTVYLAHDRLLDRDVAIKVSNAIAPEVGLDARLRREARVLARLEHPGIVPVHDAGLLEDGRLFYVMKLVRGETLVAYATRISTEATRLTVFERVAETVAFAHAAGVVHRDLKPSNVMVGSFGEVLVLDWGVAKIVGSPERESSRRSSDATTDARRINDFAGPTASGTLLGTPGFMAPEQALGADAAGPAADVFALGALLFWMTTGETPPRGAEAIRRRLEKAAPPPPPRRLRAIVAKCLSPDPADRYPSATDLAADLARYRAGAAVIAHREHTLERLWRWLRPYRTFILLVLAYLVMRTLFAFWTRTAS